MSKLTKKKADVVEAPVEAPIVEDVVEEVVAPAVYVDPYDFVYEVQAGKKFGGFNAGEAVTFAEVMIGKVDKIVITKSK